MSFGEVFFEILAMVKRIAIEVVKVPLKIWFIWTPEIVRSFIIWSLTIFFIFMIIWAYRNRYKWMEIKP